MTDRIRHDAHNLRKLIREAEALADESMIAFSRLKQAMLTARQNPGVEVSVGQRALMRLTQAEEQAIAMSTNLLRVHDELSKIAIERMGDEGAPTHISPEAIHSQSSEAVSEADSEMAA